MRFSFGETVNFRFVAILSLSPSPTLLEMHLKSFPYTPYTKRPSCCIDTFALDHVRTHRQNYALRPHRQNQSKLSLAAPHSCLPNTVSASPRKPILIHPSYPSASRQHSLPICQACPSSPTLAISPLRVPLRVPLHVTMHAGCSLASKCYIRPSERPDRSAIRQRDQAVTAMFPRCRWEYWYVVWLANRAVTNMGRKSR
jgi:hypothetical protein